MFKLCSSVLLCCCLSINHISATTLGGQGQIRNFCGIEIKQDFFNSVKNKIKENMNFFYECKELKLEDKIRDYGWAFDAVNGTGNMWTSSLENLIDLLLVSKDMRENDRDILSEHNNKVNQHFLSLIQDKYDTVAKYGDYQDETCYKNICSLINGLNSYNVLYKCFHDNALQKKFAGFVIWDDDQKITHGLNIEECDQIFMDTVASLKKTLSQKDSYGNCVWDYLISVAGTEKVLNNIFIHDLRCYLTQFFIINDMLIYEESMPGDVVSSIIYDVNSIAMHVEDVEKNTATDIRNLYKLRDDAPQDWCLRFLEEQDGFNKVLKSVNSYLNKSNKIQKGLLQHQAYERH